MRIRAEAGTAAADDDEEDEAEDDDEEEAGRGRVSTVRLARGWDAGRRRAPARMLAFLLLRHVTHDASDAVFTAMHTSQRQSSGVARRAASDDDDEEDDEGAPKRVPAPAPAPADTANMVA